MPGAGTAIPDAGSVFEKIWGKQPLAIPGGPGPNGDDEGKGPLEDLLDKLTGKHDAQ